MRERKREREVLLVNLVTSANTVEGDVPTSMNPHVDAGRSGENASVKVKDPMFTTCPIHSTYSACNYYDGSNSRDERTPIQAGRVCEHYQ